MHDDTLSDFSDQRRLVLKGVSLGVSAAVAAACGGGGGSAAASGGTGGSGATGSSSSSSSSSSSGGSSGSTGYVPATPSLFPSNGTAQFFVTSTSGASNAPFCIGQAFKQGEIPSGSDIVATGATAFQATVKNRWPDGSVKFAVLAGRASVGAGASAAVTLAKGTAATGAALAESVLAGVAPDIVVQFAGIGSVQLTDLIGKTSSYNSSTKVWSPGLVTQWISGPEMSCWIYRSAVGSSLQLYAYFEVRVWKGGVVEVVPWLENGWLNIPNPTVAHGVASVSVQGTQMFSFDFEASQSINGTATANVGFQSRCRAALIGNTCAGYWFGAAAPDLSIAHDTVYLQQTRLVPAYFSDTPSQSSALDSLPRDYAPLAQLRYSAYMPATGYAPSIGLLPMWDAFYLSSRGDARAHQSVLAHGYAAGRYSVHYRDETTGRPVRFSQYPTLALSAGNSSAGTAAPANTTPEQFFESAHQPSIGFMAYLLSGYWYFLEELQFMAGRNYLGTNTVVRQNSKGLVITNAGAYTTRGAAWVLRTLVHAACMTPDDDVLRTEYLASYKANIEFHYQEYVVKPSNPQGFCRPYSDYTANDNLYMHSTWMEDFFTGAWGYAIDLNLLDTTDTATKSELMSFFAWKAQSVIGRLGDPNDPNAYPFCDAARYTMAVAPGDSAAIDWANGGGPWYGSWRAIYNATRGTTAATDPMQTTPGNSLRGAYFPTTTSYWGNMMPAIAYAVEHNVSGAAEAWARLSGSDNWNQFVDDAMTDPEWAIRPRNAPRVPYSNPVKLDESLMPAWRQGQAINAWREISGSSLSALKASVAASGSASARINAKCGLAIDNRNAVVYAAANGGGADYAGNDVVSINLLADVPKWSEQRGSSSASSVVTDAAYYTDGAPSSRHSYFAHQFVEQRNRAMQFANAQSWGSGNTSSWTVDGFNIATKKWDVAGAYPASGASGSPVAAAVALDAASGDVYLAPNGGKHIYRWNQEANNWSDLASISFLDGSYTASAFDTQRKQLLLLGGALNSGAGLGKAVTLSASDGSYNTVTLGGADVGTLLALPSMDALGLVYAAALDCYLVCSSAGQVFRISADTFAVTLLGTSGSSMPAAVNGIYTRFLWAPKLGGVVFYPDYTGNLWFLRLL